MFFSDHVLGFQEDSATLGAVVYATSSWRQAVNVKMIVELAVLVAIASHCCRVAIILYTMDNVSYTIFIGSNHKPYSYS